MNENRRISLAQLVATLQDAQAEQYRYVSSEWVMKVCLHLETVPSLLDEDPASPIPEGCQHLRTVETPTLGRPGGKLCLDCDQNL